MRRVIHQLPVRFSLIIHSCMGFKDHSPLIRTGLDYHRIAWLHHSLFEYPSVEAAPAGMHLLRDPAKITILEPRRIQAARGGVTGQFKSNMPADGELVTRCHFPPIETGYREVFTGRAPAQSSMTLGA
ncbi:MAG: hypothetical protein QM757_35385 [Paludibaculum sp.]